MLQEAFSPDDHRDNDLREIIDIRDPALNVDEIIERIETNRRQRHWLAGAAGVERKDISLEKEVNYYLHKLNISHNQIGTGLVLTESQIPVVGSLWQKLRRNVHYLVLFYLNLVTKKQIQVNAYTVQTFTALIKYLVQENNRTKAELKMLQEQVARLEAANRGAREAEGDTSRAQPLNLAE